MIYVDEIASLYFPVSRNNVPDKEFESFKQAVKYAKEQVKKEGAGVTYQVYAKAGRSEMLLVRVYEE